jgi:hypothetical protein
MVFIIIHVLVFCIYDFISLWYKMKSQIAEFYKSVFSIWKICVVFSKEAAPISLPPAVCDWLFQFLHILAIGLLFSFSL